MKTLVLDNYDSFTYNLVHMIDELGYACDVFRNDRIDLEAIAAYDKIILSPGPGIPDEAGIMKALIREYGPHKSILGVCLGHQAIAEVYGARLYNLPAVLHGVTSKVSIRGGQAFFNQVPDLFEAGHYHSWAVEPGSVGKELKVTATNNDGIIMAIEHIQHDVCGVQYHPESVLTGYGRQMMSNWLESRKR